MVEKSAAGLHADGIVASSIAEFQFKLNAETEDGKYEILLALFTDGFRQFKNATPH